MLLYKIAFGCNKINVLESLALNEFSDHVSNRYLFLPFSKMVQSIFESEIEGLWFILNKQLIILILRKSNLGVF